MLVTCSLLQFRKLLRLDIETRNLPVLLHLKNVIYFHSYLGVEK